MLRGRRRSIEVPNETQPEFKLGDAAEDIATRRERVKRGERERREQEEREKVRLERERTEGTEQTEETEGRVKKWPRTDTDTDP